MKDWFKEYFGLSYILGDNNGVSKDSSGEYVDIPSLYGGLLDRTQREVNTILEIINLEPHSRILDCPCGYGRHSIELASKGYKVVGIDINPFLLKVAKYRAKNRLNIHEAKRYYFHKKLEPMFIKEDMRNLLSLKLDSWPNNFNAIINLFLSFGYFNDKENFLVLKNFYEVLREGGHLIIDTITKDVLEEQRKKEKERKSILPKRDLIEYLKDEKRTVYINSVLGKNYPPGKLYFKKSFDPDNSIIHTSWQVILEGKRKLEEKRKFPPNPAKGKVKIYSIDETMKMLTEAGFKNIELYFNWHNKPYEKPSATMDGSSLDVCLSNVIFHTRKFKSLKEILNGDKK